MTPPESTQNQPKFDAESTLNRPIIDPESTQDLWGTSGDPPRGVPPTDSPEGPPGDPKQKQARADDNGKAPIGRLEKEGGGCVPAVLVKKRGPISLIALPTAAHSAGGSGCQAFRRHAIGGSPASPQRRPGTARPSNES